MFRAKILEWAAGFASIFASMIGTMLVQSRAKRSASKTTLSGSNYVLAHRMSVNAQRDVAMAYVRMASANR